MAEALLAQMVRARGLAVDIGSAGTAALVGRPAEPFAQALVRARGTDLSAHRARQLTPELARQYELILVMEAAQRDAVQRLVPGARGKVRRLGEWGGFDIPDPYGRSLEAFGMSLALIERGLRDLEKLL